MALIVGALALYGSEDPWGVPHALKERMLIRTLRPASIHARGRETLAEALNGLYRLPRRMAEWLHAACAFILANLCGDAAWLWNNGTGISAPRLMVRLEALPGFGPARVMALMGALGRDWGVKITEWERANPRLTPAMERMIARAGWDGGILCGDSGSLPAVYDGLRTLASRCRLRNPACDHCPVDDICPKNGMNDG